MRRAVQILFLLIAGAIINILIALGSARWCSHFPQMDPANSSPSSPLSPDAAEYLDGPEYKAFSETGEQTGLDRYTCTSAWCTRTTTDRWYGHPDRNRGYTSIAFGLPLRSLQYAEYSWHEPAAFPEYTFWRIADSRGGWPIAPPANKQRFPLYRPPAVVYPVTVKPVGFLVDTLVAALLLLPLTRVPAAVVHLRRRRRGLCERCAYPRGPSSVCTECGRPH